MLNSKIPCYFKKKKKSPLEPTANHIIFWKLDHIQIHHLDKWGRWELTKMITIYRAVNFSHKTSVQRGKLTHSPTVDRLQTTEVSMARHVDSAQNSWLSFFLWLEGYFLSTKISSFPPHSAPWKYKPWHDLLQFSQKYPLNINIHKCISGLKTLRSGKKCHICEYHHAASKLDKLNGAVKKHIHQKFKSDFYTLMAEVTNNTNKIPTEIESLQTNCSLAGQPPLPSTVRHITEITGDSHSSKSFEFYSQFWKNHQLSLCTHICIHLKLLFEVQMHLAWPSWVLKDHFSPAWSTPHVVEALQIAQKLQISIPKDGHLICYKKLLPFLLSHEH